jgi:hypothetical protein
MSRWAAKLLGEPRMQRFRAAIPYSVLIGLKVAFIELPAFAIVLIAQAMGYRGTPQITLTRTWLTLGALPFAIGAAVAVLEGIAYLSGYRPFRYRWQKVTPAEALRICARLHSVAESRKLNVVWNDSACGSFIAFGQLNKLEEMCLAVFSNGSVAGHRDVEMKLANRTSITWGGKAIADAGNTIVLQAMQD